MRGPCKACGRLVLVEGGEGDQPLVALHDGPWCAHWSEAMAGRYAMAPEARAATIDAAGANPLPDPAGAFVPRGLDCRRVGLSRGTGLKRRPVELQR